MSLSVQFRVIAAHHDASFVVLGFITKLFPYIIQKCSFSREELHFKGVAMRNKAVLSVKPYKNHILMTGVRFS